MRLLTSLMNAWQFAKLPQPCAEPPHVAELSQVVLPHVWNKDTPADFACCYYKTEFTRAAFGEKRYFLAFDGVGGVARVFLNGVFLGEHRGSYTRFCFDASAAMQSGKNKLEVLADNTRYDDVNPLTGDFTYFGGIYRPVTLLETESNYFIPTHYGAPSLDITAQADGTVLLNALVSANETCRVEYRLFDASGVPVATKNVSASTPQASVKIDAPHLWDGQADPYLYTCTAVLLQGDTECDSVSLPFGFRSIKMTADQGFFLNGRRLKLHGVAKHQDFAGMGCAPTEEQLNLDMALIQEIGANAVRLSHYQHPQYTYDLCDQQGFVVWAEIPMLVMPEGNSGVMENAKLQMTELILQNKHHPSICFWGVQNEIAMRGESEETYRNVKELNALVKQLDPTRISAGANLYTVKNDSPLNFLNDAVGYNVYFGWYYGKLGDYAAFLEKFHADNPAIPLGITEYGVDCNLQFHADKPECKDYTEEYQCVFHEAAYAAIEADAKLWGSFVWNMFDFSSAIRDEGGVKAQNSKGLVVYDRSVKKDSFYYYKACWSAAPFVHITGRRYANRCGEATTVKVYSNQPQVTLCVNGADYATQTGHRVFVFETVPLQAETILTAIAGACSDTIALHRVTEPDKRYEYEKKGDGQMVSNWFTLQTGDDRLEDAFSLNDRIADLLANAAAAAVLEEYIPEIAHDERSRMFGGMSLLRILDRSAGNYSEETLKACNEALQGIAK